MTRWLPLVLLCATIAAMQGCAERDKKAFEQPAGRSSQSARAGAADSETAAGKGEDPNLGEFPRKVVLASPREIRVYLTMQDWAMPVATTSGWVKIEGDGTSPTQLLRNPDDQYLVGRLAADVSLPAVARLGLKARGGTIRETTVALERIQPPVDDPAAAKPSPPPYKPKEAAMRINSDLESLMRSLEASDALKALETVDRLAASARVHIQTLPAAERERAARALGTLDDARTSLTLAADGKGGDIQRLADIVENACRQVMPRK
jgi:hypothetical protein